MPISLVGLTKREKGRHTASRVNMVWERFSTITVPLNRNKPPATTKNGKRQGPHAHRASTAPATVSCNNKDPEVTQSRNTVASWTETLSLEGESATPVSPRADSILSGELGDSECSASGQTPLISNQRTGSLTKKRYGKSKAKEGQKTSSKQRITTTPGKRKIILSDRSQRKESEIPTLSGNQDEWSTLNRTFQCNLHRGPFLQAMTSSSTESDSTPEAAWGKMSSDSEEYDTALESRFKTPPMCSMDTTGRMGYLKACERLKVAPCSIFLRQAVEDELNLKFYGLGPNETKALSMGIRENTYMTHVDLSYNVMGSEGVIYIAKALRENQHISYLNLSYCFLGRESTGAMAVWTILEASININHLNISHNCFQGQDYIWMARILQIQSRLYELDISDNLFGPEGVKVFAEALAENDILEELKMDWNPLLFAGTNAMLIGVSKNMKLKHLSLANTGIGDIVCPKVIYLLMKNDFLQSLDITLNRLGHRSLRNIHAAMEKSKTNIQLHV